MSSEHVYSHTVQELLDADSGSKFLPPMACQGTTLHMTAHQKVDVEEYVAFLQNCIGNIDRVVEALQHKRSEIVLNQNKYQNMLNPILCMPPEILTRIFQYCIDDWMLVYDADIVRVGCHRYTSRHFCPRRTVTQVCQYMRNVALQSPEFWRDIEPRDHKIFSSGGPRLTYEISLSRSLPLRIFFDSVAWSHLDDPEFFSQQTQPLLDTCNRWSTFKTFSSMDCFFLFARALPSTSTAKFPHLVSLSGKLENSDHVMGDNMNTIDLPSLRYLDLDLQTYRQKGIVLKFPWSQLHHLRLHSPTLSLSLAVLPQLTAVRHLYLRLSYHEYDTPPFPEQPILLPCVDTLTVDMSRRRQRSYRYTFEEDHVEIPDNKVETGFISLLRLPALKTLSCNALSLDGFYSIVDMLEETDFPLSSQQGVQTLELANIGQTDLPSPFPFEHLFWQLPNLKSLKMEKFSRKVTFNDPLEILTCWPDWSQVLCPNLERLSLSYGKADRYFLEYFICSRLLHEKLSGDQCFKHIRFYYTACLSSDTPFDPEEVRAFQDDSTYPLGDNKAPQSDSEAAPDDGNALLDKGEAAPDDKDTSTAVEHDRAPPNDGQGLVNALKLFLRRPGASLSSHYHLIWIDEYEAREIQCPNESKDFYTYRILPFSSSMEEY